MGTVGNAAPILIFRWERRSHTYSYFPVGTQFLQHSGHCARSHSNCLLVNSGTNCKLWNSNKLKSTRNQVYTGYVEVALQFSSRVSILTRDIDSKSVCSSVCPSVRYIPVLDENGLTYRHSFFTIR